MKSFFRETNGAVSTWASTTGRPTPVLQPQPPPTTGRDHPNTTARPDRSDPIDRIDDAPVKGR